MSEKATEPSDAPWRDEDTLQRLYWEEEMTTTEIGDELGCSSGSVLRWMEKHDIPRRSRYEASRLAGCLEAAREARRVDWVPYTISKGYEIWRDSGTGNDVAVHQLLAIANGADPHEVFREGTVAHHRSSHRRDNRPENIEVMERGVHSRTHGIDEWTEEDGIPVLVTQREDSSESLESEEATQRPSEASE